jgi:hypothetical protein
LTCGNTFVSTAGKEKQVGGRGEKTRRWEVVGERLTSPDRGPSSAYLRHPLDVPEVEAFAVLFLGGELDGVAVKSTGNGDVQQNGVIEGWLRGRCGSEHVTEARSGRVSGEEKKRTRESGREERKTRSEHARVDKKTNRTYIESPLDTGWTRRWTLPSLTSTMFCEKIRQKKGEERGQKDGAKRTCE